MLTGPPGPLESDWPELKPFQGRWGLAYKTMSCLLATRSCFCFLTLTCSSISLPLPISTSTPRSFTPFTLLNTRYLLT